MSTERTPNRPPKVMVAPVYLARATRFAIRRGYYAQITVTPAEALRLANDLVDAVEGLEHTPTPFQRDSPRPR